MENKAKLEIIIDNIFKQKNITNQKIKDAVLRIPRELFSENSNLDQLYSHSIVKYHGAWEIADIEFVIDILTNINLENAKSVLVVGSGTGYLLSILSYLVEEVYGVEIDKNLNEKCMDNIENLNIVNAISKVGDGLNGWSNEARFSSIIVCCSCDQTPRPLIEQLDENGELIIPIGSLNLWPDQHQELIKIVKNRTELIQTKISNVFVNPIILKTEKVISE